MEKAWQFIKILSIELPSDPAISFGIYPKELKEGTPTDISTLMFIPALFTLAKGRSNSNSHLWMNR